MLDLVTVLGKMLQNLEIDGIKSTRCVQITVKILLKD